MPLHNFPIQIFTFFRFSKYHKFHYSIFFLNFLCFYLKGGIEWDFYKIPLDISEKKEFEKLEGWGKFQKQMQVIKDFDNSSMSDVVVGRFYRYIFDVMRKFITLSTYDYFNDREEKEKIIKQKQSKYFWKVK